MWKAIWLATLVSISSIPATATSLQPHAGYSLPVHIVGRTVSNSEGDDYQWPAVYFESRFNGTQIEVLFNDETSNFNIILDDHLLMVVRKPGNRTIIIHANDGEHAIRVEKRSETQYATGHFLGFSVPQKDDVLQPLHRARQIDADYQINAFSGLGMVRNYDGREHPKYHMPMLYERTIFDDPTPANQPDWHPQVIVIGIGSNNFSTPVRPDEPWGNEATLRADYVKTYTAFVKTIPTRNPNAFILLTTLQGEPEGYTGGTDDVFAAMKSGGDTK